MDNPATESNELDVNQAAALFGDLFDPDKKPEPVKEPEAHDDEPTAKVVEPEKPKDDEAQDEHPEDETITVEVDGKTVEIKKSELPEMVKGNMRQSDYTKKTMEAAEQRKQAEAEVVKAREERQQYAQRLGEFQQALAFAVQADQQQAQKWTQEAITADPVGYLQFKAQAEARQAQLMQAQQESSRIHEVEAQERQKALQSHLQTEAQALLDKLPEWKDAEKAKAGKAAIAEYLTSKAGFDSNALQGITDHRAVLLAHKAMMYDQLMERAGAAAKKVANLPAKVEKPGVSNSSNVDRRTRDYQQVMKSGRMEDLGRFFANHL